MSTKLNEKAIAGMYYADKRHRVVLDVLATMPRQQETLVETLDHKLAKEKGISHRDIVETLKSLELFGAGEYIPGRRGHPSRFKWTADSVNISTLDVAFPSPKEEEPHMPVSGFNENMAGAILISHKYALRPNLIVTLQLPADLTMPEVDRLTMYLKSLPFFETGDRQAAAPAPKVLVRAAGA